MEKKKTTPLLLYNHNKKEIATNLAILINIKIKTNPLNIRKRKTEQIIKISNAIYTNLYINYITLNIKNLQYYVILYKKNLQLNKCLYEIQSVSVFSNNKNELSMTSMMIKKYKKINQLILSRFLLM